MTKQREIGATTMQALVRLADALDTTVDELLLRAPAAWFEPLGEEHADLEAVSEADCYRLLATEEIGRVAVPAPGGAEILPVTYALVAGRPVFRTTATSPLARLGGSRVAFEVDRVDHVRREGWSVLVTGVGRVAVGSEVAGRVEPQPQPWPDGRRDVYVFVEPVKVTGRRIVRSREPHTSGSGHGRAERP